MCVAYDSGLFFVSSFNFVIGRFRERTKLVLQTIAWGFEIKVMDLLFHIIDHLCLSL